VRPAAYEVRGQLVARPEPGMILVRHEAVGALGMGAMDMMAVVGDPSFIDAAGAKPGDRVRLAVRRRGDELVLLRMERVP
jgi:Cu/Ag efflux protein CusF